MSDERAAQEVLCALRPGQVDARNADDVAELYVPDGAEILSYNRAGTPERIAAFTGSQAIRDARREHPPAAPRVGVGPPRHLRPDRCHRHRLTASLRAQFVVFEVRGTQRPTDGWPPAASGGQGTIAPIEAGYYRISLRRTPDGWKINENHTILDLPPALPES